MVQAPTNPGPQALTGRDRHGDVLLDRRGPFVQPGADVIGGVGTPLPFVPGDDGAGGCHAG